MGHNRYMSLQLFVWMIMITRFSFSTFLLINVMSHNGILGKGSHGKKTTSVAVLVLKTIPHTCIGLQPP